MKHFLSATQLFEADIYSSFGEIDTTCTKNTSSTRTVAYFATVQIVTEQRFTLFLNGEKTRPK